MRTKSVQEIKKLLQSDHINDEILHELRNDSRKGVHRLIAIYDKKKQRQADLKAALLQKWNFDNQFRINTEDYIAGVDEAGRGPLAGPVVAAAVILPADFTYTGLNDSKQLTEVERNKLYQIIITYAISYSVSVLPPSEIDRLNILEATKHVMKDALLELKQPPKIALIDAVTLDALPFISKDIIKGDEKSLSIAAASIIAKVTRDKLMIEIDEQFPMYEFKKNKGYGTKEHLRVLSKHGPSIHHRKSFSPVQKALNS